VTRPYVRRIDLPAPVEGGGSQLLSAANEQLPAPIAPLNRPEGLTITGTGVGQSAVTPVSFANLSWNAGPGTPPRALYEVQQAHDSGFTLAVKGGTTSRTSASMDGIPGQLTYYRVRASLDGNPSGWSNVVSTTLPQDTAAPGPPTGVTAVFAADGTLEVRATPPSSANYKHMRVEVRNAANTAELDRDIFTAGVWRWPPARNRLQSGGSTYATSVTVRVYAVSWGNIDSTLVTVTAVSAAPLTPTGLTHTWVSDTGVAGADLTITHVVVVGLSYFLSIDGVERPIPPGRYLYPFGQNVSEHAGVPDPVLALSLVAENGLGQRSLVAASATATNVAPPATSITVFAGFSSVGLTITPSAALDVKDYRVRVYRSAILVRTVFFTDLRPTYAVEDGDGSYTFDVAVRDVFGQVGTASAQTAPAVVTDLAGFVDELRSGAVYSDSLTTLPETLYDAYTDDNRASGGISYLTNASWVRWVRFERNDRDRYRTVSLAMAALSGTTTWYLRLSEDGVAWTYFAGPVTSGRILTAVASAAAAQAAAVSVATLGGAATSRVDLPAITSARYIEVWLRNTTGTTRVDEFYPRRLVQSDDLEAESIKAVNIAAGTITGDRINATAINGFTITGATIQTAASGQRVVIDSSGLKTYDSLGVVQVEATTATDGALLAGAGKVKLDKLGLSFIAATAATTDTGMAKWYTAGGTRFALIDMYAPVSGATQGVFSLADYGSDLGSTLKLIAARTSVANAEIRLINIAGTRRIELGLDTSGFAPSFTLDTTGAFIGGTNLTVSGNVSAAQYSATGTSGARVGMTYDNTNDAGYLFAILDGVAYKPLRVQTVGGSVMLGNSAGGSIGFYGTFGTTKPTITGSRGANAALASLLTALASMGLITNSTS
jgi:hypothetical protein